MRSYFYNSTSPLLQVIINTDEAYSALDLSNRAKVTEIFTDAEEIETWKNKTLHGRYPTALCDPAVDEDSSLLWLKDGYLHIETEGFITAIQDGVIRTRNYEKYILKSRGTEDICRKCKLVGETIEHITAGCGALANNAYLGRHNMVAKIVYRQWAIKYGLVTNPPPYYKYSPDAVLENHRYVLYWDRPIITDRTVDYNRPDLILIDKDSKKATIVDIGCPLTSNLQKTEIEKVNKYQNLAIELKHTWQLEEVKVVPIIISVTGIVSKSFSKHIEQLSLPKILLREIQKAAILQTCHIVRKFLNT